MQFCNATIGWYEITKADNAVAALKATLKPVATAKRDGSWQQIDGALLVPGDCVLLGSGSAVPADCKVQNDFLCHYAQRKPSALQHMFSLHLQYLT
jgi:H+-transporting ATPase